MILKSAEVAKFKCVMDSSAVRIEDGVTCLVGKNESGKTAFLEALYRLNPVPSGHKEKFVELYDYPRKRRSAEKDQIKDTCPITAVFELEAEDVAAVAAKIGEGVLASKEVTVSKNYENTRIWEIGLDERKVVEQLVAKIGASADLIEGCQTVPSLVEKLKAMTDRPEAAEKLFAAAKTLDIFKEAREVLTARLPKFVFFSTYTSMPGRFSIPYIQNTDPAKMTPDERTALSLLKLADVQAKEFAETDYEARKAALESAAVQITQEVFEYWTQNQDLRVTVDADFKTANDTLGRPGPFLDVRIWNDRHQMSLNFSERSTGFVWFFSFLAFFSEFRSSTDRLVLLLDEPGKSLHPSAQGDLLRFIDEKLSPQHQVVYTTHSPFMVKPTELHRARTVEDVDNEGTKISSEILTTKKETIFPIQAALGYELAQTLFVGPDNLVVEGTSDILYLQVVGNYLRSKGRTGLDARWTMVPAGGSDKIPAFVSLLGSQLNIAVLMDVGSAGIQRVADMAKKGILAQDHLFPVTEFTGGREADIEDLFAPAFYLDLLRQSGIASVALTELPKGNRIMGRLELHLGAKFDHYAPAYFLLREQLTLLPKLDDATLDRFEALFTKVNAALPGLKISAKVPKPSPTKTSAKK